MGKTKIDWCDYTINPVKGLCPVDCKNRQGDSYCYARRMYKRFGWNPEIRYDSTAWRRIPDKPSLIFIGSTIELFGDWVDEQWLKWIFADIKLCSQHTFIFLTKKPENLLKWSPFPDNCWIGASATDYRSYSNAILDLQGIEAKVKFLSIEPLLSWADETSLPFGFVDWIIIGQQTPPSRKTEPRVEWVRGIVSACDKARIPVFLKDNLYNFLDARGRIGSFWNDKGNLRQEFPKVEGG